MALIAYEVLQVSWWGACCLFVCWHRHTPAAARVAGEFCVVAPPAAAGAPTWGSLAAACLLIRVPATAAAVVLQVVEKCHELGILHGDLKPANFVLADRTRNPLFSNDINLLFGEPWLLAIDFGCSQYLGSQRFTKRTGTPGESSCCCYCCCFLGQLAAALL